MLEKLFHGGKREGVGDNQLVSCQVPKIYPAPSIDPWVDAHLLHLTPKIHDHPNTPYPGYCKLRAIVATMLTMTVASPDNKAMA